eukprot:Pompholyxophrys_punicea_v1_NODE_1_length_14747_cov_12.267901.p10 type:complete len:148 gc:universal NODE_1_length_14747_cov_12.267901:9040-9483(+)
MGGSGCRWRVRDHGSCISWSGSGRARSWLVLTAQGRAAERSRWQRPSSCWPSSRSRWHPSALWMKSTREWTSSTSGLSSRSCGTYPPPPNSSSSPPSLWMVSSSLMTPMPSFCTVALTSPVISSAMLRGYCKVRVNEYTPVIQANKR